MKKTLSTLFLMALCCSAQEARWPAPEITEANFKQWMTFIKPSAADLKWTRIRWHKELSVAKQEAERLQRPILLFTMNGNPCGET
ncbi:MAG: hypothetical protein ACI9TH_004957 [Kiritimatiellia bacterium]|jgi:hypothetical protein